MGTHTLREHLRNWYERASDERIGTLVCDGPRLRLGRSILCEREKDGTVIVNNFHWPEDDDRELRALIEALPWDRIVFVSEARDVASLSDLANSMQAFRDFDRIVFHNTLGTGPVVREAKGRITCLFSGRRRTFVAGDVLREQTLTDLRPTYGPGAPAASEGKGDAADGAEEP